MSKLKYEEINKKTAYRKKQIVDVKESLKTENKMRSSIICLLEIQEDYNLESREEAIFEEVMPENFTELLKEINLNILANPLKSK